MHLGHGGLVTEPILKILNVNKPWMDLKFILGNHIYESRTHSFMPWCNLSIVYSCTSTFWEFLTKALKAVIATVNMMSKCSTALKRKTYIAIVMPYMGNYQFFHRVHYFDSVVVYSLSLFLFSPLLQTLGDLGNRQQPQARWYSSTDLLGVRWVPWGSGAVAGR